jgi:hypothetical protein
VLGQWLNVPGNNIIPCNILVNTGDVIGVIGHRSIMPATNFNALNSYGAGLYSSNILGVPVTLNRLLYQNNILNIIPGPLAQEAGGSIGRVELYVAPPCVFPDGIITYELLDAQLQPTSYANVPGSVNLHYTVTYPNEAETVTGTVNFHNVVTDAIVYTHNFTGTKLAGQTLDAIENIPLPGNLPRGYFRVEVIFNTKNSCGNYDDWTASPSTLLLLDAGAQMCIVYPGDTDDNGVVNYADRASLNHYIHQADLRSSWLNGPTRLSVIGGMDYIAWRAQPSAPWQTPDGCYKDTDGNGVINNFDYIAIKMNWLRTHSSIPNKDRSSFSVVSFDMDQNFPNPFNPTTSIRYSVPERSMVRLVVTDMFGREVAMLANETVETGVHTVQFDAGQLASGTYITTISMVGAESGLTFNKTMKMALNK